MVVPEGTGASRAVQVSQSVLKVGALGLGLFVLLALVLGYATVSRSVDLSRAARLERENQQLAATLGQLNARISSLSDTLGRITQRDARIRLLANLEPTDPQVLQAGIGGPAPAGGAPGAPRSELVRQATEVTVDLDAMIRRANLLAFSFGEAADSLESHKDRLAALQAALGLPASAQRVECFDVSHTMGERAVASCVVFDKLAMQTGEYRRFNVTPQSAGDDYAAMREALSRRCARVVAGEYPAPDLLVIDGGKGQVAVAANVL